MRRVVPERLGIVPDELPGGHLPALAHPDELVDRVEAYRTKALVGATDPPGSATHHIRFSAHRRVAFNAVKLVEIVGIHIEATTGLPLVLLREHDAPHRVLPIFVGNPEAASIALALSGQSPPRPLAHDLMAALVEGLDAHLDAVEVTDLRDGAFLAELAITGPAGGRRLDTRPSDAIALAVRLGTPMFVSDAVLDEAGTVLAEEPDEAAIDEEVAEFRNLLDELDNADIALAFEPPTSSSDDLPEHGDPTPDESAGTDDPDA